jgi:hypothetical protein
MTLHEYLLLDRNKILNACAERQKIREKDYVVESDKTKDFDSLKEAYNHSIEELLLLNPSDKQTDDFEIEVYLDTSDDPAFVHVHYINKKFEGIPDEEYDINDDRYQKYFAMGFTPWNELLSLDVTVRECMKHLTPEEICAELLWEITFYGFTEEKMMEEKAELDRRIEEIDNGSAKLYTIEEVKEMMDKTIRQYDDGTMNDCEVD